MPEIPPFPRPIPTTLSNDLTDYLNEYAGPGWRPSGPYNAFRCYDGIGEALAGDSGAQVVIGRIGGPVSVRLAGDLAAAVPLLRDPTALLTRVREALSLALTSTDTDSADPGDGDKP